VSAESITNVNVSVVQFCTNFEVVHNDEWLQIVQIYLPSLIGGSKYTHHLLQHFDRFHSVVYSIFVFRFSLNTPIILLTALNVLSITELAIVHAGTVTESLHLT
jgi:hypothetical protein